MSHAFLVVACSGLFAGKPAPTGISANFKRDAVRVGAGLPAKRPAQAITLLPPLHKKISQRD
ncbi:hypothetical protein EFK07_17135 [Pseudomonas putida]|uniref:Uncharacterized protein n=1 Tax=Pseudomonas putida TaxID=303 RepID=A0A3M8T639_PSEPU|nr:hypothetical protein EFK07_17135 [Pseudomonas putida]